MSPDLLLLAAIDGISYASLLFIISLGLTLIFGVYGVINVAHGSLYAIGGYTAATLVAWIAPQVTSAAPLIAALFAAALITGTLLGSALELGLRRFRDRDPVVQLLVTFAAFMVLEDIQKAVWGATPRSANEAAARLGNTDVLGISFLNYQLVLMPIVALSVYLLLQYLLRFSVTGKKIVAVIHHREVAVTLGIDAARTGLLTFAIAGVLGALGGALSVPTASFVPGLGADMIVSSFAVIATAGLGQITGALLAALLIGLARSLAIYTWPEMEVVMPYLMMVLVLHFRPHGLFTISTARRI